MTDNEIKKGDICIYHYADGNGSVNIVEVVEVINRDVSKIKCTQVIHDNSGNGWFKYMLHNGTTMNASNVYLHKIYCSDLINRQKADIERLEKENSEGFKKYLLLDKRTKERYAELYEEAKDVVRTEAIKEFAERLKKEGHVQLPPIGYPINENDWVVYSEDINNIMKEMTKNK